MAYFCCIFRTENECEDTVDQKLMCIRAVRKSVSYLGKRVVKRDYESPEPHHIAMTFVFSLIKVIMFDSLCINPEMLLESEIEIVNPKKYNGLTFYQWS